LLKPTHTLTWFSEKIKEPETFGVGRLLSQKQFTIRRKRQLKQAEQTSRREENGGCRADMHGKLVFLNHEDYITL